MSAVSSSSHTAEAAHSSHARAHSNGPVSVDGDSRQALRTLALIKCVHLVTFALFMPFGPQFARVMHLSAWQHGLMSSAYPLAAGLSGFAALFFTDRFAGRRTLLFVCTGFGLCMLACATAPSFPILLVARTASGGFGGLLCAWLPISVTRATSAAQRTPALRRALGWAPGMAIALALPFVICVGTELTWRIAFGFLGVVMLLALIGVARLPALDHPAYERHASERQLRVLLHQPRNRLALFIGFALAASSALMVTFFSGIMVFNGGFTEHHLALFFLTGGVTTLVAMPSIERLSSGRHTFNAFLVIALIAALAYAGIAGISHATLAGGLLIAAAFMLTNAARFSPASVLINLHLKPRYVARFLGMNAVSQQFAAGLGMFTAGLCITRRAGQPFEGVRLAAVLAIGLLIGALLLSLRLRLHPRSRRGALVLPRESAED